MGKITNLLIDTSLMGQGAVTREFTVKGKPGSEFIVIVIQDGTLKYYNFENNLFELGHTSKNNLKITMSNSSSYKHTVDFPSGGGTYVIKVVAEEGTVVKNNKKIISKNIEKQSSTTTITLKPATVNTDNYSTFATVASTGSVGDGAVLTGSFLVNNASTDVGGHGLKINTDKFVKWQLSQEHGFEGVLSRDVFDSFWYVQSTKAITTNSIGDGQFNEAIAVADADGISVGMELFYHKTTTVPVDGEGEALEGVHVVGIEQGLSEAIIHFSQSVAFEDGETMTLRAYGSKNIYLNLGVQLEYDELYLTAPTLVKTVREDSDGDLTPSQTITLTDTHGLSGGNTVGYLGLDVDNTSSNLVNVVTPDCPDLTSAGALDNNGTITVQLTQTLKKGTLLSFKGVYNQFNMKFTVKINNHPESNTDVLFDLDKVITVGVSGS